MSKWKLILGTAVLAAGLAGCATRAPEPAGSEAAEPATLFPGYSAPTEGPTVPLALRGAVPAGEAWGVYLLRDHDLCTGHERVGLGNSQLGALTSTRLPAERLATVDFVVLKSPTLMCTIRWTFTPRAGRSYAVVGRSETETAGCASTSALVLDTTDPDNLEPLMTAQRRNSADNGCIALSEARTIAAVIQSARERVVRQRDAVLKGDADADDLKELTK